MKLIQTLLEATIKSGLKKNSNLIDPALLTYQEYAELVNPDRKTHGSDAYDSSISDFNRNYMKAELDKSKRLFTRTLKGIQIAFFGLEQNKTDSKYVRHDADGNLVKVDGEVQYYSKRELETMFAGRLYSYEFFAVDDLTGKIVGGVQDEWGCMLVRVAAEYQGLGIGPELVKLAREYEPEKHSGGFTPAGKNNFKKVHSAFVKNAMAKGFYSKLVNAGQMTASRAKEIVSSANFSENWDGTKTKVSIGENPLNPSDLYKNETKDWLLADFHSMFVLYNKKLIEMWNDDRHAMFLDRFILGVSYAGGGYHHAARKPLIHFTFGGQTDPLKKLMMKIQLAVCRQHGDSLRVMDEDMKYIDESTVTFGESINPGEKTVIPGKSYKFSDYADFILAEHKWRKSVDKYNEFEHWLMETAEQQFKDEHETD
jgi:GNAT superfamily N-acetyltransferase